MNLKTFLLLSCIIAATAMPPHLHAMDGREENSGRDASQDFLKQNSQTTADQAAKAFSSEAASGAGSGAMEFDDDVTQPDLNSASLDQKQAEAQQAAANFKQQRTRFQNSSVSDAERSGIKSASERDHAVWQEISRRYGAFIQNAAEGSISEHTQQKVLALITASNEASQAAQEILDFLARGQLTRVSARASEEQNNLSNNKNSIISTPSIIASSQPSLWASFSHLVRHSSTRFVLALRAASNHLLPGAVSRFIDQLCTATLRIINPIALANTDEEQANHIDNRAHQSIKKTEQISTERVSTDTAIAGKIASAAWNQALGNNKSVLLKSSEADKSTLLPDGKVTANERKKEHDAIAVTPLQKAKEKAGPDDVDLDENHLIEQSNKAQEAVGHSRQEKEFIQKKILNIKYDPVVRDFHEALAIASLAWNEAVSITDQIKTIYWGPKKSYAELTEMAKAAENAWKKAA